MPSHTAGHDDEVRTTLPSGAGVAWPLMTPSEVAAVLHVDANTLARWANDGKLTAVRTPGGHRRYLRSEVLNLARPRRTWPSSPPAQRRR
jgi:excisionase family DNA binding protein